MQNWNSYNRNNYQIGGGLPVWVEIPKDVVGGAYLLNDLQRGEILASGSPVEYNHKTHEAKILKCFEVANVQVSGSTSIISLKKVNGTPWLYAGMNLMVAPAALDDVGLGVVITSVDQSVDGVYTITVDTASIDTMNVGDFLVEADSVGITAKMYAIPNNLTKDDTVGGDQNTVGIPRGEKYIYENIIPSMPKLIKEHIVNVAHVEFAYFPEIEY